MRGNFVVFEGVSGSGKTSLIEELIRRDQASLSYSKVSYSKGFERNSFLERLINQHPSSLAYYAYLTLKTFTKIKPKLRQGYVVLQDRYVYSVDSFAPDCYRYHNELFRKLFKLFMLQPDLYIHISASADELVKRLSVNPRDNYRAGLVKNPEKLIQSENNYRAIYQRLGCQKYSLDTTGKSIEQCADELLTIMRWKLKC